jgi:fused signal recognition particle receptor
MFNFIKKTLATIYTTCTAPLSSLFAKKQIDETTLKELEHILIKSDTGFKTTQAIIKALQDEYQKGSIVDGSSLQIALKKELLAILANTQQPSKSSLYLLVGINGSGKTTLAAKLAFRENQQNKKVLLVAADTFRAAAQEQLAAWAQRVNVAIELGKQNQDPAAVVFTGCQRFIDEQFDTLIIDTAGRLQTKTNLMKELEKIKRIITQKLPDTTIHTILTIDAMLGQNSFEQAKIFNECTKLDSIALTKMDGTGKGGIIFAIAQELKLPVSFITYGESIDQIKPFNATEYIEQLIALPEEQ